MRSALSLSCIVGAGLVAWSAAAMALDQNDIRPATLEDLDRQMMTVTDRPGRLSRVFVPTGTEGFSANFIAAGAPPEGDMAQDVAMNATTAIVINRESDTVTFFDLPAMTATTVAGGDFATDVALTPDGTKAVVVNLASNNVQIWNMATKALIATVPVTGDQPYNVKITPNGTRAVVGVINDAVTSAFSVIDLGTNTEILSIPTTGQGVWLQQVDVVSFNFWNLFTKFDVNNLRAYYADITNNTLNVYNLSTGANEANHPLDPAAGPVGIDLASNSSFAIVQHQGTTQLSKIALPAGTLTSISTAPLVVANGFVELTPSNSHAVVTTANTVTGLADCEFINATTFVRTTIPGVGSVWDPSFDGNVGILPAADMHLVDLTTLVLNGTVITATAVESAAASGRAIGLANRRFEELQVITTAGAGSLLAQTQTGNPPEGDNTRRVAVTPDGTKAVGANISSGNVTVFNLGSNTVAANIPTGTVASGTQPFDVAINPAGTRAVVPNSISGETKIIDLTTNTVIATLPTPFAASVAINPAGTRAYVSTVEQTFGKVHVINLNTNTLVTTIDLGEDNRFGITFPYFAFPRMTFTPDGSRLLVPIVISDRVVVINTVTNTIAKKVDMGAGTRPLHAPVVPAGNKAFVTNSLLASVGIINPMDASTTPIATLTGISQPIDAVIDSAGTFCYVNSYSFDFPLIWVIDANTNSIAGSVPVNTPVRSMERNGSDLLAATVGDGVSFDPELVHLAMAGGGTTVVNTAPLSGIPAQLAVSNAVFIGGALARAAVATGDPDGVDTNAESSATSATLIDWAMGLLGNHLSGDIPELIVSDNTYHVTRSEPGFLATEPDVIYINFGFQSPNASPASLELTDESRINQPGGTVRWFLKNWSNNQLELVHTYSIGTTESTVTLGGISAANRVRASDNRIEWQVRTHVIAAFSAVGFDQRIDLVGINVN